MRLLSVLLLCSFFVRNIASECAIFSADDYDTYETMKSTYVELPGLYNVIEDSYFEISYDVFPSAFYYSGAMFSLGKPSNFGYYTYTKKISTGANKQPRYENQPQYVSLQFDYKSLNLLLKSNVSLFNQGMSVPKTWPDPYNILDGNWHYVHAYSQPGERKWTVSIDDVKPVTYDIIPGLTNITFYQSKAYIGGRPGYTDRQFRGIIRNVFLNGHWVSLSDGVCYGMSEIVDCDSSKVRFFQKELGEELELYDQYMG